MIKCSVDWCVLSVHCKGFCEKHYWRYRNNYPMNKPFKRVLKNLSLKDKLLARIDIDPISKCWVWNSARDQNGYGKTTTESGILIKAHRASYVTFKGPLNPEENVCHHCDNPPCINPDHLFKGSQADNQKDMGNKERAKWGEAHPHAKLTEENIIEIFKLKNEGYTQGSIARYFKVNQSAISRILNKKRWRHLTDRSAS